MLTGWHLDHYAELEPTLVKFVGNEVSPRRKALVAIGLMRGEPPAVTKALVERLKAIDPEAYAAAGKMCPLSMKEYFV